MCLLLCKCSREKKMFTAKNKRGGYWDWICKRLFVMYYSTSALTFRTVMLILAWQRIMYLWWIKMSTNFYSIVWFLWVLFVSLAYFVHTYLTLASGIKTKSWSSYIHWIIYSMYSGIYHRKSMNMLYRFNGNPSTCPCDLVCKVDMSTNTMRFII